MNSVLGETLFITFFSLLAAIALACPAAYAEPDFAGFPKWERVAKAVPVAAGSSVQDVKPLLDKLHASHRSIPFAEDRDNYGIEDYWATPAEFRAKGSGDCEDFAIAGYYALLEQGVPEADMRIMVVHMLATGEIHAVLRVEDWWLDQRAKRVMPMSELSNYYQPIYSINRLGWERGFSLAGR